MKTLLQLMAVFVGMALLGSAAAKQEQRDRPLDPVDRIIGDGSFNAFSPMILTDPEVQKQQYSEGLRKILALLENRDLSGMPAALREQRRQNIERLREYRERGIFPVNIEHPGQLLPCFIDSTGAICAAGYLIEQSAGREFAEAIDREYRYATIAQITSPALDKWIACSGLTRSEIATIQRPSISSDGRVISDPIQSGGIQDFVRTPVASRSDTTSADTTSRARLR